MTIQCPVAHACEHSALHVPAEARVKGVEMIHPRAHRPLAPCAWFMERVGLERCTAAPDGWRCMRYAGHSGPCAAEPAPPLVQGGQGHSDAETLSCGLICAGVALVAVLLGVAMVLSR